jgi:hypothetical protein
MKYIALVAAFEDVMFGDNAEQNLLDGYMDESDHVTAIPFLIDKGTSEENIVMIGRGHIFTAGWSIETCVSTVISEVDPGKETDVSEEEDAEIDLDDLEVVATVS